MTNKQLILYISSETGLDAKTCKLVIDSFVRVCKDKVHDCKTLKIKNLGTFKSYVRSDREMISFGGTIQSTNKLVVKFKPSKNLIANNKIADILERI